jgi:hypothetical protein
MMTSISLASAEVRKPFPSATPVEQITEMRQKFLARSSHLSIEDSDASGEPAAR